MNNIEARGPKRQTPLLNACETGNDSAVAVLLKHHASIAARDTFGSTPALRAAAACKLETLKLLVSAGCSIRAKYKNGTTALMVSVDNPDKRVFNWLMTQGIDVNARGIGDCTTLSAAEQRYKETVDGGKPGPLFRAMISKLRNAGARKGGAENYWFGEEGD